MQDALLVIYGGVFFAIIELDYQRKNQMKGRTGYVYE
jgi:hypothetical protein